MFCQPTATFFSPELSETRHTNNVQIFIISEAIQHVFLSIIPLFVKNKWQQIIFHERPNTFDIICLEKSKYQLALRLNWYLSFTYKPFFIQQFNERRA